MRRLVAADQSGAGPPHSKELTICSELPKVYLTFPTTLERREWQTEHAREIRGGNIPYLIKTDPAQLRETARYFNHIRRLVSLSAIGHRRQIRTIGFDE